MNDVIFADNVPFAAGYRFRVTNLVSSAQVMLDRPIRDFKMSLISGVQYNATYSVEVAVKNTDGTYLPYGALCNITTPSFPTSQLQTSQCDAPAVASMGTTIYADSYPGATAYRFEFVSGSYSYTFDRPIRSFVLSTVPGLVAGTTYSVRVAIQLGGVFGPFGKICSLTTPGVGKAQTALEFKAVAFPNPFANNFMINVSTSSEELVQIRVYDMLGKLVEDRQVNTISIADQEVGAKYPSGVYNVIVSQGENTQTLRVIKR